MANYGMPSIAEAGSTTEASSELLIGLATSSSSSSWSPATKPLLEMVESSTSLGDPRTPRSLQQQQQLLPLQSPMEVLTDRWADQCPMEYRIGDSSRAGPKDPAPTTVKDDDSASMSSVASPVSTLNYGSDTSDSALLLGIRKAEELVKAAEVEAAKARLATLVAEHDLHTCDKRSRCSKTSSQASSRAHKRVSNSSNNVANSDKDLLLDVFTTQEGDVLPTQESSGGVGSQIDLSLWDPSSLKSLGAPSVVKSLEELSFVSVGNQASINNSASIESIQGQPPTAFAKPPLRRVQE